MYQNNHIEISSVQIEGNRIETYVANNWNGFSSNVKSFFSNERNTRKVIGLSIERAQTGDNQSRTALFQLCDGNNCLIVQLPYDKETNLPVSLFNFLNLPTFTFVGVGINKTLTKLESEFGLTCNNALEVGPSSWDILNKTEEKCRIVRRFVSFKNPDSVNALARNGSLFEGWNDYYLSESQIELATANAYFAYKIGNELMAMY